MNIQIPPLFLFFHHVGLYAPGFIVKTYLSPALLKSPISALEMSLFSKTHTHSSGICERFANQKQQFCGQGCKC